MFCEKTEVHFPPYLVRNIVVTYCIKIFILKIEWFRVACQGGLFAKLLIQYKAIPSFVR